MPEQVFQDIDIQGKLKLSGTHGASVKLPVLTTTMRDALAATIGMEIFNSTTGQREMYDGIAWGVVAAGSIGEAELADKAVTGPKIGLLAIEAKHIAATLKQELGIGAKEVRANEKYAPINTEIR